MMVKHGHDFDYVSCGGVDPFALVMLFEEFYSAGLRHTADALLLFGVHV